MRKLTVTEILDEIVDWYSDHPRGLSNSGECCYAAGCAIAYVCGFPDEGAEWDSWEDSTIKLVVSRVCGGDFSLFEQKFMAPEYHGHSRHFWTAVQHFHDDRDNWVSNDLGGYNLSELGRLNKEDIIRGYSAGEYSDA